LIGGKESMKKIPLVFELFISIVLVLIVPLMLTTYLNSEKIIEYSENEIAQSAEVNLKSVRKINEMMTDSIKKEIINLSTDTNIKQLENLKSYDMEKSNVESILKFNKVDNLIKGLAYPDSRIHSIYFYMQDADYIITSNNSTVRLDQFNDKDWMETYTKNMKTGQQDVWMSRRIYNEKGSIVRESESNYSNVISYLYTLTPITTNIKGVLVVNLYESAFSKIINNPEFDQNGNTFIINQDGQVVAHVDKNSFRQNLSDNDYIKKILGSTETLGYVIEKSSGDRTIYVYYKTKFNNWIYVSSHSLDLLMDKANNLKTQNILITMAIMFLDMMLVYAISKKISGPINSLVRDIKNKQGFELNDSKNELVFLSKAFEQIVQQESKLTSLLELSRSSANELYIMDLLNGNLGKYTGTKEERELFKYIHFVVAMLTIDKEDMFLSKYTPEQRYYLRSLLIKKCEETFVDEFQCRAITYDNNTLAIIINLETYDCTKTDKLLKASFNSISEMAFGLIGNTISVGIGGCHSNLEGIKESSIEATEALKRKLIKGNNSIIFWNVDMFENNKYFYPYNREKHILNYLSLNNFNDIEPEIAEMINEIKSTPAISCDNAIQIFNQLIGSTVKYLVEANVNISDIFGNIYNVYRQISSKETLEDIEQFFIEFYSEIVKYTSERKVSDTKHIDRILEYINMNYRNEIDFEQMATDIGISYSYIRKIVKEVTGKSLLDYVNILRINEAKRLIRQTDMTITEIASNLGYNNIQSFSRFFKKYEGITPGEFRNIKQ
jgi:AraC-like DNA-binding protein